MSDKYGLIRLTQVPRPSRWFVLYEGNFSGSGPVGLPPPPIQRYSVGLELCKFIALLGIHQTMNDINLFLWECALGKSKMKPSITRPPKHICPAKLIQYWQFTLSVTFHNCPHTWKPILFGEWARKECTSCKRFGILLNTISQETFLQPGRSLRSREEGREGWVLLTRISCVPGKTILEAGVESAGSVAAPGLQLY